jgi:hypothetical protein
VVSQLAYDSWNLSVPQDPRPFWFVRLKPFFATYPFFFFDLFLQFSLLFLKLVLGVRITDIGVTALAWGLGTPGVCWRLTVLNLGGID